MTLQQAMIKIENYISKMGTNGDPSYSLDFSSKLHEQDDGSFVPEYRADILYMWCGYFEPTIELALISLANELERIGE